MVPDGGAVERDGAVVFRAHAAVDLDMIVIEVENDSLPWAMIDPLLSI